LLSLREAKEVHCAFVADRMLGKLAKGLRMLGYDTIYWRGETKAILEVAKKGGRILLTRNKNLHGGRDGPKVVFIYSDNPQEQLKELITELNLSIEDSRFTSRCLRCNGLLVPTRKEEVEDRVPDFVYQTQKDFCHCKICGKIYWKGSHLQNMKRRIQKLRVHSK
jgi:uncharacterized protein with PIN domain